MARDICEGEFVDGQWLDCGCTECAETEADAIERDHEAGSIGLTEALDRHYLNGTL